MDIMTLMALGGLGKDLLSGGSDIRDLTAGMGDRDINARRSRPFYADLTRPGGELNPSSWYNFGKAYAAKAGTALDQASSLAGRSSVDIMGELGRSIPGASRIAEGAATKATSRGQASMADLAEQAAAKARINMENRFGAQGLFGTRSGGTLAALMAGQTAPLLQARTASDQAYGNAYAQNFGQLLSQLTSREFGRPQEMAGIGGSYMQGVSTMGQQGGLLAQLLAGQAEPMMVAPQFQTKASGFEKLADAGLARLSRNAGYGQGLGSGKDTLKLLQDILGPEKGLEIFGALNR